MSLVNVFTQIRHCTNGCARVDIYVGFVPLDEIMIVRHHPNVIEDHSVLLYTSAIVPPTLHRVLMLRQSSFLCKLFGEAFGAHSLLVRARLVVRKSSERTVHQESRHRFDEICLLRVAVVGYPA